MIIFAVVACKQLQTLGRPTVLKSPDGRFQLTVPGGWSERPALHESATIKAANLLQETYVIVLTDNKSDFADDTDLDKFTEVTRRQMLRKATDADATEPVPVSINGIDGRQYELDGIVNNIKVSYLVTALETESNYHQIVTWTLQSRKAKNHDALLEVTRSFLANGPQN